MAIKSLLRIAGQIAEKCDLDISFIFDADKIVRECEQSQIFRMPQSCRLSCRKRDLVELDQQACNTTEDKNPPRPPALERVDAQPQYSVF